MPSYYLPTVKVVSLHLASLLLAFSAKAQIQDQLTAYWSFDNTLNDQAGSLLGSANTNDDNLTFQGSGSTFGGGFLGAAGYLSLIHI